MATHSSILSCRIPWTEKPDRLQSMGSQRVRHDWVSHTTLFLDLGVEVVGQDLRIGCIVDLKVARGFFVCVFVNRPGGPWQSVLVGVQSSGLTSFPMV